MIKQIKYFQAVVRCKSFTEAAEECHISQSAISQQIQALEKELGIQLIQRENRKFSLTSAGEHFYRRSVSLIEDFEKLCADTSRIANQNYEGIRIGYLKGYVGQEFRLAISDFSEKYPKIPVKIITGNHEELYEALKGGKVDLVLSDQRRAFSDEYENHIMAKRECCIEIAARNPLALASSVEITALRDTPCILVASPEQQENERAYYQEIIGIRGEFVFAENLEEARLLVSGGKGFMPVEGAVNEPGFAAALHRLILTRRGKPLYRTYCAFWKADNSGYYIEDFAEMLESKFTS